MPVGMHTVMRWSLQKSELVVNTEVDTTPYQTDLRFMGPLYPNDPWYMLVEFVPTHRRTQCKICVSFIFWF